MNLLVSISLIFAFPTIFIHYKSKISLGVSVAFFSSIAELAISASRDPNDTAVTVSTTYFDSVAFLTTFLLIGA